MKQLQKYSMLFVIVYCNAMHGMLINKKFVDNLKTVMYDRLFTLNLPAEKLIKPYRIAHERNGVLGSFDAKNYYSIQEYFKKYLEMSDDKVEWRVLKKAYNDFLFYNMPSNIYQSFAKNTNVSHQEVKDALLFTRDVARSMRHYLCLDTYSGSVLPRDLHQLTDENVKLFSLLGVKPAAIAQTWDGLLGNFALLKEQNCKARCTIQDYLCKYIANNLQIPEEAVATEATFLDIKKAFESFVNHNHPDAILRDFENELINKQHAKDALAFTFWVVNAFEKYLEDCKDDAYEMELFELFWQMNRMKDKAVGMRFVEKGEWNSSVKE